MGEVKQGKPSLHIIKSLFSGFRGFKTFPGSNGIIETNELRALEMTLGILQGVKAKFCPRILGNFPTLFIVLFFPNRPRILGVSRSVTKFKAIGSF